MQNLKFMILLRSFQTGGAVALAPTKPAPAAKPRTFEELSALTPKEFASLWCGMGFYQQ